MTTHEPRWLRRVLTLLGLWMGWCHWAQAGARQDVVDVPTRPGVTVRLLVLTPEAPKLTVLLLPGGHGGLQMGRSGSVAWGAGNFLVRTRQTWAEQGAVVAVMDAPSDRQSPPFLAGWRQTPEHLADVRAPLAWLRRQTALPVWLVGTSRGTQSAAFVATELDGPDAPDGLVLTATILSDAKGRAVPAMPLGRVKVPVLVVHHAQDGCSHCPPSLAPTLLDQFTQAPRKQFLVFSGGDSLGDPCEAMSHHGFRGIEGDVVGQAMAWMRGAGN